jgi:hypothetical protein
LAFAVMVMVMDAAFNGAGFSVVEGHSNRRTYGLSGACRGNLGILVMRAGRMIPTICARECL